MQCTLGGPDAQDAILEQFMLTPLLTEELGSDEDDIDEDGQEYLEILAKQAGEDGEDEDWEEDDAEETALEGYSTLIDDEDTPVDEYQIFKAIFQSKSSCNCILLNKFVSVC